MPTFRMPLAENSFPSSNPLTWHFNPLAGQTEQRNIELGRSSAPQVEEEILSDVASYGRQLGRIEEALAVLLDHFKPQRELRANEQVAITELRTLLNEIAEAKARGLAKAP